jgi:cytochrome b subunit of formate dehydrogenase
MIRAFFGLHNQAGRFARDEGGAVTVDWVVLTASMVILVTGVFITINEAVMTDAAAGIAGNIEEASAR